MVRKRNHLPRRRFRRLRSLRERRETEVLLQPPRTAAFQGRWEGTACLRRTPGADGVLLRRRRARQRRNVTLYVNGELVGEGRVEATVPMIFSGDERLMCGGDTATRSDTTMSTRQASFRGEPSSVQIDIDEAAENVDHVISPEERMQIAMARRSPWPGPAARLRAAGPLDRTDPAVIAAGNVPAADLVRLEGGRVHIGSEERVGVSRGRRGARQGSGGLAFSIGAYAVSNGDFSPLRRGDGLRHRRGAVRVVVRLRRTAPG